MRRLTLVKGNAILLEMADVQLVNRLMSGEAEIESDKIKKAI